ncbi:514_t:CDS:2, partial [Funneliformis caledonium]
MGIKKLFCCCKIEDVEPESPTHTPPNDDSEKLPITNTETASDPKPTSIPNNPNDPEKPPSKVITPVLEIPDASPKLSPRIVEDPSPIPLPNIVETTSDDNGDIMD